MGGGEDAPFDDVRARGFTARTPLARAEAALDAIALPLGEERLSPGAALGRVLAADVVAANDIPPADRAAIDGYALAAADTEGASAYNPMMLARGESAGGGRAVAITAGTPMPEGADAVLGFTAALEAGAGHLAILTAAAVGEGVETRADAIAAGAAALAEGHRLAAPDLALLAMLALGEVRVRARPRVRTVLFGPKAAGAEALAGMLEALVGRDGGRMLAPLADLPPSTGDSDVVMMLGRSGVGMDDVAAPSLAAAGGRVLFHGVALRPGGSSGLGVLRGTPVLLLPGDPLACFIAYDVLGARLLRRLAGLPLAPPYARAVFPLTRKIVSAIGFTDVVPIALAEGRATPLASAENARLPATSRAAGFVVVPEGREGYGAGEEITVHLYGGGGALL